MPVDNWTPFRGELCDYYGVGDLSAMQPRTAMAHPNRAPGLVNLTIFNDPQMDCADTGKGATAIAWDVPYRNTPDGSRCCVPLGTQIVEKYPEAATPEERMGNAAREPEKKAAVKPKPRPVAPVIPQPTQTGRTISRERKPT